MAVLKIHVIRQRLDKRVAYVQNTQKTACSDFHSLHGIKDTLTSGFNCSCEVAYTQMLETKRHFKKTDKVQGFHFIQSFKPGEVTPEQAHQLGCEFIERCFANDFEVVIGTHTDRAHIHNHIIVNSVSFVDGHKYQSTPATFYELRGISDEICKAHGLSVIQNPSVKAGKHYAEWRAEKENRPTLRSMIREDIDVILAQARTMDDFWDMLRGRGYEIRLNERRKYVTIRHPNGERFIRLKSLGEDYTPRQLAARIAAQRGNVVRNIEQIRIQQQKLGQRKKYYPMPHTAAPKKHKKLHGFRALYWRYLYMLGKVQRRKAPRKVRGEIMSELKKLDRYTKQYYFLRDHQLSTRKDVALYADAIADEIDILADRRARLYADRCRPETDHAALQTETKQLTAELRRLRQEQRLCAAVQNTAPAIKARLDAATAEQKRIERKIGGDQHEPGKRSSRPDFTHGTDGNGMRGQDGVKRRGAYRGAAGGPSPQREADRGKDRY
ncbi:relaxase/mobilization nuclease domain-containing protein [Candidatus Agathobaculum pullicola]|uniref:relaxase/mobilization nuclease domain-containing protein n=1 Tax=Candidatus Agathobaculum pullicola TaxID=2838426 RepID=UPI003F8EA772